MARGKGTELANAYVTLIPSLDGAQKAIEADLAKVDVTGAGKKMGTKLGESIGDKAGKDASGGIERGIEKADVKSRGGRLGSALGGALTDALSGSFDASSVTDALGDVVADASGSGGALSALGETGSGALGAIAKAAPIAGAAVAAIGGVAIDTAADFEVAEARITAAVGGVGEEAEALTEAGRTLYRDGWGESMTDLSDALITAREILGDISEEDMSAAVEGALALEQTYGSDLSETLRGARVLMERFGLSAEEAMDLMVAGTQRGLDYTDELGDNLSEYAGRWADAGIEASEYFSLLEAGVDNGAYSLDKAGDFLNEFLTSLTDGRMEEAIGSFSEGTQDTFEAFKSGGADAQDVLNAVVGELAEMPSGYEKAQIASGLWSSLGEDNAMSMIESFAGVEDTFDDVAGASKDMTDQVSNDLGSRWETAMRKWQDLLAPAGEAVTGFFGGVADAVGGAADALDGFINQQSAYGELDSWFGLESSLSGALDDMGVNVDYLKLKLSEVGVGMEEMDAIGSGHIRALATTFNGSVQTMVWAIENYNDVPLIDKDGSVDVNDAELVDAQGNVYTWNGSELVDKNGNAAVNDQQLIDAQGRIYVWNGSSLKWQQTGITVDTSSIDSAMGKWARTNFPAKVTRVAVQGATVGQITQAEGGIIPGASTKGFIATGPTLLDGGTRLVGEAGAEAVFDYGGSNYVVPLTNRKYSAPFADVVAKQVAGYLGGGAGRADQSAVVAAIAALRADIAQMGVYLDTGKLVGGISPQVNRTLGRMQRRGSLS
ncbi:phage tail tape measure protein [Thermophilibacter provencensis]|uniref:Phage tail tape measure protein n=1 Tax=Thermophilibacter provencensis TaxID=1852386 RepID=A0ABT7V1R2_9ACTN|nr:phage tail tape measure protein [Thermophilibacter provencensis]MDM8270538.1 phage tail tape measure protein [Thermophilibacter provencensis]